MVGFALGWIYGHLFEWAIHKYVLHSSRCKKKNNILSFHFLEHHSNARANNFTDSSYSGLPVNRDSAGKEALSLLLVLIIHAPLLYISKGFFLALMVSLAEYYYKHRKAHTNPEWARHNLSWHYEHHMCKDQDSNFGVRSDWVDVFLGTRKYTINNLK